MLGTRSTLNQSTTDGRADSDAQDDAQKPRAEILSALLRTRYRSMPTVVIPPCHNTHDDYFTHPHQRSISRHWPPRQPALTSPGRWRKWKITKKENVNQNSKITKFPIQNNVCFLSSPCEARLYDHFLSLARIRGVKVETGEFGATMELDLVNDGR
jgi:hypothetical protein